MTQVLSDELVFSVFLKEYLQISLHKQFHKHEISKGVNFLNTSHEDSSNERTLKQHSTQMTLSPVAVKTVYKSLFRNAFLTQRHLSRGKHWFFVEEEITPFTKFAPDIKQTFKFGNDCLTSIVRSEFKKNLYERKPGVHKKCFNLLTI